MSGRDPDAIVVGAGIVGLCVATAVARKGLSVVLVSESRKGEASSAAAGMLAPSVERADGPAHDFAVAARDLYPSYLERLADDVGIRVPLNQLGVLQVALTERGMRGLQKAAGPESEWLDRTELTRTEPALGHALGAVVNHGDGAVDNVVLMAALTELAAMLPGIRRLDGSVVSVSQNAASQSVTLRSGESLDAMWVVLAPGAWGSYIRGAPALRVVTPSRGQLVSFEPIGLRHVVYGPRGYVVPRAKGPTIAGSTMENVGFEASTTAQGIAHVRSAAEEIAPALAVSPVASAWAGLRPVTPDMLPLLGQDAERPGLVYACGHSRNGILLAPLTGDVVAAIVSGGTVGHDLAQFRPARF